MCLSDLVDEVVLNVEGSLTQEILGHDNIDAVAVGLHNSLRIVGLLGTSCCALCTPVS